jgi:hypothetical protein
VRKQFGKPLAEFQWNQFKLAEMATKLVTARLVIREAAKHLTEKTSHMAPMCALAKQYVTDTSFEVGNFKKPIFLMFYIFRLSIGSANARWLWNFEGLSHATIPERLPRSSSY